MLKLICFITFFFYSFSVFSQKKIGDFIESTSYNDSKRGVKRYQQYFPEGNSFVCINGENRYTRALYGGYTDYRIETSDRPIFAIYKKNNHRNICFVMFYNGMKYRLDSLDFCKAWYADGMRNYLLRDKRWGKETLLQIKVVALTNEEGAIWRFSAKGFSGNVAMQAHINTIATPKLHRNGDIGADKPGVFESSANPETLETFQWICFDTITKNSLSYFVVDVNKPVAYTVKEAEKKFNDAAKYNTTLGNRIQFVTPDPYINTLGSALVMAADGDWDGQTWLHGCIGWRMPLAGWRAGYLGDVLGWNDRAEKHFDAYAKSQVTDIPAVIPHPSQDAKLNNARAVKEWGTQMYSDGYICRNPENNHQMHHYDMNLNYIDELLWHFQYNADTVYLRKMWPVIKRHLSWEKRNFDPDGDHLYDAYCCIWASDALYYNSGAVTHSSAYNYRANLLAAQIATLLGEDGKPYADESQAIRQALNNKLWIKDKGYWAEFKDAMGLGRLHESAAVWSVYTPIDCGVGTSGQAYQAVNYINTAIPHIPVENTGYHTISTTNWLPYSWSINNVAAAEVMHTSLACFMAGRPNMGYQLLKANILDQMYYGSSPANFGQISFYDAARGECYRDFGDCIGISSRTLIQGLFGILPMALENKCIIRPGFPVSWDSVTVRTPYLTYHYQRKGKQAVCRVIQNFAQPLQIVFRQNLDKGEYRDYVGTNAKEQRFVIDLYTGHTDDGITASIKKQNINITKIGLAEPDIHQKFYPQRIDKLYNAKVTDIFTNQYLSPRSPYTTLQIPIQGIGEWCHPLLTADINDSVFRSKINNGMFVVAGVPFHTVNKGKNIIYTTLWDNYPDAVEIPFAKHHRYSAAYLLMAGSTNHMQSRIANGEVIAVYDDLTQDTLSLVNPDNWCPIEQDYFIDNKAFSAVSPRPYRVSLGTGVVSRNLRDVLGITGVYGCEVPGGAAQMLKMPLNKNKRLLRIVVRTLSNDVVIGLMGITLQ